MLSERDDIIVVVDEAHRTQYKDLAENMRKGLPNAQYIAFTGTPLLGAKRLTNQWFGDYVSEYNFSDSIEDNATVPLYYVKRVPEVSLVNEDLFSDDFLEILEDENLTEEEQKRLENHYAKELEVIKRDDRLDTIAKYIVKHFPNRGFRGKGMVVSVDKFTAVKMYDKVQRYWHDEIKELNKTISQTRDDLERKRLKDTVDYMNSVEMAVVISTEGTEEEEKKFQKEGLTIKPHVQRMSAIDENGKDIEDNFKDPKHPLQLVFVCAMWLTGFDAPSISTLYLDKPMKGHTLMQTIARANRVAEGKSNGLVIDYIGIVKALRQALADYTANPDGGDEGNDPTVDKEELIKNVWEAIVAAETFLHDKGFELEKLIDATMFEKLSLLKKAANALCDTIKTRKTYCTYSTTLLRLWKYLNREDITENMRKKKDAIEAIYKELQKKRKHADITDLSVAINDIVNEHLEVDSGAMMVADSGSSRIDISGIDFDLLRREFAKREDKNLVLRDIQDLLQERLARLLAENPSRINFYEKYQEIIKAYNQEQNRATIEKTFEELMHLSQSLSEEEKRYAREGFKSDEELSLYDLLLKDNLSKTEVEKLKNVAIELLAKIKEQLAGMDHPFDKPTTRATLIITIREVLWDKLPDSYDLNSVDYYRDTIYNYISQRYGGVA